VVKATPQPLYPRNGLVPLYRWLSRRASLDVDGCGKSHPPLEFNPSTIKPIASYNTDYTIPDHLKTVKAMQNNYPSNTPQLKCWNTVVKIF